MTGAWFLIHRASLTWWDRVRVLAGVPLYARFVSPDGECHAACRIEVVVQAEWPGDPRAEPES